MTTRTSVPRSALRLADGAKKSLVAAAILTLMRVMILGWSLAAPALHDRAPFISHSHNNRAFDQNDPPAGFSLSQPASISSGGATFPLTQTACPPPSFAISPTWMLRLSAPLIFSLETERKL